MKVFFDNFYKNLFLKKRLFLGLILNFFLFIFAFLFPWLGDLPFFFSILLLGILAVDLMLLYRQPQGILARRDAPERLSNGDNNSISIHLINRYPFKIKLGIIDEIPFQFQKRNIWFETTLKKGEASELTYLLRPTKRGEYDFGKVHLYASSFLGMVERRFSFDESAIVPVYPSFLQMRKYELLAITSRVKDVGIKKIRRIGHSMEFDHVKNYAIGDDPRSVNWKASARKGEMMVNSFTDEKSQNLYCIIDKSRTMKMPFEGLSLLDYAINASLVISNIALLKDDKAGLITISEKVGAVIPAERRALQMKRILQVLYNEKSRYLEINIEALYGRIRTIVKQRSLILFFTNFESISAMERQLPYLKRISKLHQLIVIFFENTELEQLKASNPSNIEDIYIQTIATKFIYEKKQIVLELAKHGIQSLLTKPEELTVNTINRYLEIKARHLL